MKKQFLLYLSMVIFIFTSWETAQANNEIHINWREIRTPEPLEDFSFYEKGDGFSVGSDGAQFAFTKSKDGFTFNDQRIQPPYYKHRDMTAVSMVGEDAYIFGKHFPYGKMERQMFNDKYSGYGFTFHEVDPVRYPHLLFNDSAVQVLDKGKKYVWAVGEKGLISRVTPATENSTWKEIVQSNGNNWTSNNLLSVFAIGKSVWTVGEKGAILTSIDEGKTWKTVKAGTVDNLHSIWFLSEKEGWISGENGILLKTVDGGKSWNQISLDISNTISNMYFMDRDNGFLTVDKSGVYYTNDGGFHWTKVHSNPNNTYKAIDKNSLNEVWILQNNQSFLATSDFDMTQTGPYGHRDVFKTTLGNEQIAALTKERILNGFNGYFRPADTFTRAETVTVLSKLVSFTEQGSIPYTDVKPGDWYGKPIGLLSTAGIVKGFEDGSFRPTSAITLEQFSKILYETDRYLGRDVEVQNINAFKELYRNAEHISSWALNGMAYAYEQGYLEGLELTNLQPNVPLKRRDAAVVIYNYHNQ
ncbi:S-layer homology domain-containing protein [Lysinibacillus sp. 54212]|uniref:S-layer homology domain-containing protein n=1 Tax=Lysinibacillus sp. 54212 TaxID=3119829 RepID=UPI002FC73113